jgi:hypothetical protein
MKIFLGFVFIFSLMSVHAQDIGAQDIKLPPDFHKPFWKSKPDVEKRILKDHLVVVSADTDKVQDKPPLHLMKVVAGGAVDVPFGFTFKTITDYEKLKDVDDHFKESKYDKDKKTLFLHMEALSYHARMHLKLSEVELHNKKNRIKQVQWECVEGQFKGMKGVFQVEEIERQKTEISMTAVYRSETLPLPKVLMGLGLEIIGRQVATKIRDYITNQYKNR